VYIDNGTPVITFHQNQDIRRISRFNVALFTTNTVNTKTVLPEIREDVYFLYDEVTHKLLSVIGWS
jgi:hypothetical protein